MFLSVLALLFSSCCPFNLIKDSPDNNVSVFLEGGAKSPLFDEPSISMSIADEPYQETLANIQVAYYGFDEDCVRVSFETTNIQVADYTFSEDHLVFSVKALSNTCVMTFTISDETKSASRTIAGYSTEFGTFYDDSLNHAQRKSMAYKHANGYITDEQFDFYNSYACSDSGQTSDPNASYALLPTPRLGSSGSLLWRDDYLKRTFPLKGVQVELIHYVKIFGIDSFQVAVVDETVYTDELGRYCFGHKTKDDTTYFIRVNAINQYGGVEFVGFWNYYRKLFAFDKNLAQNESSFCFEQHDDVSRAMQITQPIYYGGRYAERMSGTKPEFVNLRYPSVLVDTFGGLGSGAANQYLLPGLYLGTHAYSSWDTVLHEYGHWMQHCYGYFPEIPAVHYIDGYTATSSGVYFGNQLRNLELPWQEGWPDVFALQVTKYFSSEIGSVKFVNDSVFHRASDNLDLEPSGTNFENVDARYGDCGELTIGAVLYDMYDSYDSNNPEFFDIEENSDSFMWDLAMDSSVKNFSDFCRKAYSSSYINQDYFGMLLSHHGMAVDKVEKSDAWIPSVSPTFYFDKCNSSGGSYDPYASDRYLIQVYDNDLSSGTLLFEKTVTNAQSFSFSRDEWDTIIHTYGLSYAFRIRSSRTNSENPPGDYWSRPFTFHKPNNNASSSGTFSTSTRLQQIAIDLFPSSNYQRTVSFSVSGYKIFQTLGELDTKIAVYDASGSLVAEDDDGGYGYNALVGLYCSANQQYKVKVTTYDAWASGRTRLLVTASPGFRFDYTGNIERYEDIVNLSGGSWVYSCWALQYESLMITYTPGQSGYHTISLTSVFDNYLYVIDPRSGKSMFDYGTYEYDDNGGSGKNARLHKHLDQGVPYLIVFCQNNPAKSFTNLDEGDDLEIKIEVG